jgi:hypothetical protein
MQRNPMLAGLAAGIAGSYIGNMLFGATDSSARTNDAGEQVGQTDQTAGASSSTGILLILMLLGAGAFYYFLKYGGHPLLIFRAHAEQYIQRHPADRAFRHNPTHSDG